MNQDYHQDFRRSPSGPAIPSGRRELPVWLQYVGVIIPLIVGLPTALLAIRSTTLDPLFWCSVLAVSIVVGFTSVKRSGPGRVALVATAVGVAAAVGAAGSFGYDQGRKSSLAPPDPMPDTNPARQHRANDPSSAEAEVRHEGNLVLIRANTYVDLDAPADDPQWGTLELNYRPGFDLQLRAQRSGIADTLGSVLVLYSNYLTDASLTECQTTTGYSDGDISFTGGKEGDVTCIRTDEGRYSRLKFVSYDSTSGALTLTVTTWENTS